LAFTVKWPVGRVKQEKKKKGQKAGPPVPNEKKRLRETRYAVNQLPKGQIHQNGPEERGTERETEKTQSGVITPIGNSGGES